MWAKKLARSPGKHENHFKPFESANPHTTKMGNTCNFKRLEENVTYEICIKNLPKGITEVGIKSLLTTGEPLRIKHISKTQQAFVTFRTYKEAELTVRHLDNAPPHNLKVNMNFKKRLQRDDGRRRSKKPENEEKFYIYSNDSEEYGLNELLFLENDERKEEIQNKLTSLINILGYNPSIRMYQSWLVSRSGSRVSLGRGFTYMGDKDRFVGGLQAFHSASENFNLKNEVAYPCKCCKSLTARICGRCEKPYCSLECLKISRFNHEKDGCNPRTIRGVKMCTFSACLVDKPVVKIDPLPLKPDCTVVITTYHTLRTLHVRQVDKPWDEKFCKLSNDIAAAALKGKPLKTPEVGLLCIARYYEDLCFYRAEICSVEEEKVNVIFIDFGNCQETDIKDLKEMPDQLKEERKLATKVALIDVPDGSSLEAVDYFNQLTAGSAPLILKSIKSFNRVVLMEKDSNTNVNNEVTELLKPSWSKRPVRDSSVNCEVSETDDLQNLPHVSAYKPFYYDQLQTQGLEIGENYNFVITFFDEEDFDKTEIFWVVDEDSDSLLHVKYEMKLRMMEWCNFVGNLPYLPRASELCIAYEGGELHRCVNLKSVKTSCFLFFVDDGQTAWVETKYIRKMERDFLEVVSQAISVKLTDNWKENEENKLKVRDFLKDSVGRKVECHVHKKVDDYFIISIPKLDNMLK